MLPLSAHALLLSAPHRSAGSVLALLGDRRAAVPQPMLEVAGQCAVLCASDHAATGIARGGAWSMRTSSYARRAAMHMNAIEPGAAAQSQAVR
ncbi:hypothetical protein FHT08_003348 [Xanthomonas campestris]|uniref:hypothetical protein n=1 Tax=Xanthomonas TaxID=338 RepID=UPI0011B06C27|nr:MULTISPECIES: hypothetical protein [Xanthomonas]NIJ78228.1 hypothetical protein [Xanthomonas sp. CFBP 8151]